MRILPQRSRFGGHRIGVSDLPHGASLRREGAAIRHRQFAAEAFRGNRRADVVGWCGVPVRPKRTKSGRLAPCVHRLFHPPLERLANRSHQFEARWLAQMGTRHLPRRTTDGISVGDANRGGMDCCVGLHLPFFAMSTKCKSTQRFNPFRVDSQSTRSPRVARSSQPWAGRCNPFRIEGARFASRRALDFGAWSLEFVWSLGFEIWNFHSSPSQPRGTFTPFTRIYFS
jgi:hypothetical protein